MSFKGPSSECVLSLNAGHALMYSLQLKTLFATLALAASGMAVAQNSLLNVSYDVAREFY